MTHLWFEAALFSSGWAKGVRIRASQGRIEQLAVGVEPAETDEHHGIGLPGVPNLHSHAFQRGRAGLTERRGQEGDSFWTWRELMYRFVERITPEDLEALASLAYAEMLESGFTHVGEFYYLHHDRNGAAYTDPGELAGRIAAAAAETGIGLTLLPTFYAHGGFGGTPAGERQKRFINTREGFAAILESSRKAVRPLAGSSVGVAPHSLRAVTPEELLWLTQDTEARVIHIHIAEQTKEVEDCLTWSGQRPVEWLLEHAHVDERCCLVHATHVNSRERAGMVQRGAVVGLCRSRKQIWAMECFRPTRGCNNAGRSASDPIPTC